MDTNESTTYSIPDAPLTEREREEDARWERIIVGLEQKIAAARARKAPPHIAENAQRLINGIEAGR